ncbi:carboxypeptidase regulatory-like domain-containing protein [bacterium]|nr:carboxypeptidase regulatory-like domain-containing protein [bacterium]
MKTIPISVLLSVALLAGTASAANPQLAPQPSDLLALQARSAAQPSTRAWFGLNEPMSSRSPESAARNYLASNADRFGGQDIVTTLELTSIRESRGGTHVTFRQTVDNIPVYHGEVRVHLNRDGLIAAASSSVRPVDHAPRTDATLSGDEARRIAARVVGGASRTTRPRINSFIFVDSATSNASPAWVVHHSSVDPLGDWEVVIDAFDGTILALDNRMAFEHGEGLVFDPDPLTTAEATYDDPGFTDNNDADTPELSAERVPTLLRDITFHDNAYWLEGPYVEIVDFEAPAINPVSSATLNGFTFTRSQSGFEDVCAYAHIDEMQRHLRTLGFTNLQDAPITVDAHAANGQDLSYYSPEFNRLGFGEGGVDDAEDADVLRHEYGHALHHDAVGGDLWGVDVRSIAEGLCDYWAATLSARTSDFRDNWVYNWDGHNSFWDGRVMTTSRSYPDDWADNLYDNGTIWANSLWIMRGELDPDIADAIVAQSMYYLTPGIDPEAAAQGMLQAEDDLFDGNYRATVYHAFAVKGFLVETGTLAGMISDDLSGDPVAGATVEVDAGEVLSGESNASGEYEISDIPVGEWPVTIRATGYRGEESSALIELETVTTLDAALSPYVASVNVDSLNLFTYIGANADSNFTISSFDDDLYYLVRAEPEGVNPVTPYELHNFVDPPLPDGGEVRGLTFLDDRFYVLWDNPPDEHWVYVFDDNGFLTGGFTQPVTGPDPFYGLTDDGTDLYSIDNGQIVQFTTSGQVVATMDGLDDDIRWITHAPDTGWLWCATEDGTVTAWDMDIGFQWGPYESELPLHGLTWDAGREDRTSLVLLVNDGTNAPQVRFMHPGYGTLSDESYELYPNEPLATSGAAVFTGLQQGVDFRYFATMREDVAGYRVQLHRIRWTVPYLTFDPQFGYMTANSTETVAVHADSDDLDADDYAATISLFFPLGGQPLEIPFTLRVTSVAADDPGAEQPAAFAVTAPSPNPCNTATVLTVMVPHPGEVSLAVYDILGRQVDQRVWMQNAGTRRVTWTPAPGLASGVFLLRVQADGFAPTMRKVVVVK